MKIKHLAVLCSLFPLLLVLLLDGCRRSDPIAGSTGGTTSPYRTWIDDSTLAGSQSPFIMPYNRAIDGAGQSVSFGDANVENHSLDAVLLPDQKTVVVEDRFGLAFFDVDTHQLMSRWEYNKDGNLRGSMSSFSGIKAIVHHDSTYIFWGAGGRGKPNSRRHAGCLGRLACPTDSSHSV